MTCRVLGFSPQAYLQVEGEPGQHQGLVRRPPGRRGPATIHPTTPPSATDSSADELAAERGITASENRVHRLCSAHGIFSVLARKRGRRPGPESRCTTTWSAVRSAPACRTSCGSPTSPSTLPAEGKLYLCAVKDVFSDRIVGYSMDHRMKASLAVAALRNAIGLAEPAGTLVHSDRGSQFRSGKFVRRCCAAPASSDRWVAVGTCADNAAMESFFALLQKNVLDRQRWQTREELRLAIVTWIERTYHRRRRQRALGKLTPIEFEACPGSPVSDFKAMPRGTASSCHQSGQPRRSED